MDEVRASAPKDPGDQAPGLRHCLRCGGERMEPGDLNTLGGMFFHPANSTFSTLMPNVLQIRAFLCLDFGSLELVRNVKKAETLVGGGDPKQRQSSRVLPHVAAERVWSRTEGRTCGTSEEGEGNSRQSGRGASSTLLSSI
jgi:hypothetical protein